MNLLQQRLPFLQRTEEALSGRTPVILTDVSRVSSEVTTPKSLQHVGSHIVDIAKGDWTTAAGLAGPIIPYLTELVEFWEMVFKRHRDAAAIFAAASERPYCLVLRSFSSVTEPLEVPGGRVVMFVNEPGLDANLAATLAQHEAWLIPVSCMHTDDMQLLTRALPYIPSFRVQTANWRTILTDAIAASGSLIVYLEDDSPGMAFEIERIRADSLEPRTLLIHRGDGVPSFAESADYAGVMHIEEFLQGLPGGTGPGALTPKAEHLLRAMSSTSRTRTPPSHDLLNLRCEIVDSGASDDATATDPGESYFVTSRNAAAFIWFVEKFPDSLMQWNAISQDIRLRGIQPSVDDFNDLYTALRMAFVGAACLGFTSSMALVLGLLCKVTSMAKQGAQEDQERVGLYMRILDIALRFDALTEPQAWAEKIEAFRESIVTDPYMPS